MSETRVFHPSLREPGVLCLTVLMALCAIGGIGGGLAGHVVTQPGWNKVFWLLLVMFFGVTPFVYHWRVRILISADWVDIRDVTGPANRVRRADIGSLRRLRRPRGGLWFFGHDDRSLGVLRDVWTKQQVAELCALLDTRFTVDGR